MLWKKIDAAAVHVRLAARHKVGQGTHALQLAALLRHYGFDVRAYEHLYFGKKHGHQCDDD
jgi:hypothetical protein